MRVQGIPATRLELTDDSNSAERESQVAEIIARAQRLEVEAQRLRNEAARLLSASQPKLPGSSAWRPRPYRLTAG